jgi:hypothetical protein
VLHGRRVHGAGIGCLAPHSSSVRPKHTADRIPTFYTLPSRTKRSSPFSTFDVR